MAPAVGAAPATTDDKLSDVATAVAPPAPFVAAPVAPTAAPPLAMPGRAQSLPREIDRAHQRWTAEEKEQRRLRRNIITATAGVILLLLLALVLMKIAG